MIYRSPMTIFYSIIAWGCILTLLFFSFTSLFEASTTIFNKATLLKQSATKLTQIEEKVSNQQLQALKTKAKAQESFALTAIHQSTEEAQAYLTNKANALTEMLTTQGFKLDNQQSPSASLLNPNLTKHRMALIFRGKEASLTKALELLSVEDINVEAFSISHLPDDRSEVWMSLTVVAFEVGEEQS